MGERGGHFAHRGEPRDVNELGLQFLEPGLGLLVLGEGGGVLTASVAVAVETGRVLLGDDGGVAAGESAGA